MEQITDLLGSAGLPSVRHGGLYRSEYLPWTVLEPSVSSGHKNWPAGYSDLVFWYRLAEISCHLILNQMTR